MGNHYGMQQERLLPVENKVNSIEITFEKNDLFILAEQTIPTESNTVLFVGSRHGVKKLISNQLMIDSYLI